MDYRCTNFIIQELVPPKVYSERGEKAWELLDWHALRTLDMLRTKYGPITVNNWHWGGERKWSGLRTPDSPFYSPYSQHTFGRAFDCLFSKTTAEEVRKDILDDPNNTYFEWINSLELNVDWLHFDTRNCSRILTYNP